MESEIPVTADAALSGGGTKLKWTSALACTELIILVPIYLR